LAKIAYGLTFIQLVGECEMCKFIQRSSMLCMYVLFTVLFGVSPVQAQANLPDVSPFRVCYLEIVIVIRCEPDFSVPGEIAIVCQRQKRVEEVCF